MSRPRLRSHAVTLAVGRILPYRDPVSTTPVRLRLGPGWARVVAVGWIGVTLGLASVGASSQVIGRPVWWADDGRWGTAGVVAVVFAVFAASTGVVVISFRRGPNVPHVSIVGGFLLAVGAVIDRHSSPGGAVVTGALATSAILIGIGSFSGRRPDQAPENRSASATTTSV